MVKAGKMERKTHNQRQNELAEMEVQHARDQLAEAEERQRRPAKKGGFAPRKPDPALVEFRSRQTDPEESAAEPEEGAEGKGWKGRAAHPRNAREKAAIAEGALAELKSPRPRGQGLPALKELAVVVEKAALPVEEQPTPNSKNKRMKRPEAQAEEAEAVEPARAVPKDRRRSAPEKAEPECQVPPGKIQRPKPQADDAKKAPAKERRPKALSEQAMEEGPSIPGPKIPRRKAQANVPVEETAKADLEERCPEPESPAAAIRNQAIPSKPQEIDAAEDPRSGVDQTPAVTSPVKNSRPRRPDLLPEEELLSATALDSGPTPRPAADPPLEPFARSSQSKADDADTDSIAEVASSLEFDNRAIAEPNGQPSQSDASESPGRISNSQLALVGSGLRGELAGEHECDGLTGDSPPPDANPFRGLIDEVQRVNAQSEPSQKSLFLEMVESIDRANAAPESESESDDAGEA